MRRPLSVGARLALLNGAVLAGLLLAFGAILFALVDRALVRGAEGILHGEMAELEEVAGRGSGDEAALRGILQEEIREHRTEGLGIRVSTPGGAVIARSDSPVWDVSPPGEADPDGPRHRRTVRFPGDGGTHLVVTRRTSTAAFGPLVLEISIRMRTRDQALQELLESSALLVAVVLLGALAAGYFLARRALSPVGRIEEAARRIGSGPPGARLPVAGTGDELDRLAETLNGMLGRLEDAAERNLRFAGDVAHEVRTPLATLRARLEALLGDPGGAAGPGAPRERVEAAIREVERVETLVRSLLQVCRAEEDRSRVAAAPLDLAALAREVRDFFAPLAESRGIPLEVEGPATLPAAGDAASLQRALSNLVDNALRYADGGGAVRLLLHGGNGRARIEVEDGGRGLPEGAGERVFDRFFRTPDGRARNPDGTGLGLALVRAVARAHGGEATYRPRPGGGSVFGIEIPSGAATGTPPPA